MTIVNVSIIIIGKRRSKKSKTSSEVTSLEHQNANQKKGGEKECNNNEVWS
jgi:hypothetical protein